MHAVPSGYRESGEADGASPWDTALLGELGQGMSDASICGLGQAAANPVLSVLKYFPEDMK